MNAVARMSVDDSALRDPKMLRLCKLLGWRPRETVGALVYVWAICYDRETAIVEDPADIDTAADHDGFAEAMISVGLATAEEAGLRLRGVEKRIAYLKDQRESGSRGGSAKAANRKAAHVDSRLSQGSLDLPSTVCYPPDSLPDPDLPETRSQENQISPLLSGSTQRPGEGAPPPSKTQPGASQHGSRPSKPLPPEAVKLATLLLQLVVSNHPASRLAHGNRRLHEVTITRWGDQIRKLHDTDHMSWNVIEGMIRWCQADDFWKTTILGAENLRERWDTMGAQRNRKPSSSEERSKPRPGPTELAMRDAAEERSRERP